MGQTVSEVNKDNFGAAVKTFDEIPRTKHKDLNAFFKHIGFDRKNRTYLTKEQEQELEQ